MKQIYGRSVSSLYTCVLHGQWVCARARVCVMCIVYRLSALCIIKSELWDRGWSVGREEGVVSA